MKSILCFSVIFFAISMPVHAELTPEDLNKIRLIIKEEIKEEIAPLKADIESLKISVARLEGRLEGIEGRFSGIEGHLSGIEKQPAHSTNVTYGLIAIIAVAIGVPAWRGRRDREQERKMAEMSREIDALKQQRIVNP